MRQRDKADAVAASSSRERGGAKGVLMRALSSEGGRPASERGSRAASPRQRLPSVPACPRASSMPASAMQVPSRRRRAGRANSRQHASATGSQASVRFRARWPGCDAPSCSPCCPPPASARMPRASTSQAKTRRPLLPIRLACAGRDRHPAPTPLCKKSTIRCNGYLAAIIGAMYRMRPRPHAPFAPQAHPLPSALDAATSTRLMRPITESGVDMPPRPCPPHPSSPRAIQAPIKE